MGDQRREFLKSVAWGLGLCLAGSLGACKSTGGPAPRRGGAKPRRAGGDPDGSGGGEGDADGTPGGEADDKD